MMVLLLAACMPHIDCGSVAALARERPVRVVEIEGDPGVVDVVAMVRAGYVFDPAGREGTAALVASTLASTAVDARVHPDLLELRTTCPFNTPSPCLTAFFARLQTLDPTLIDAARARAIEAHDSLPAATVARLAVDRALFAGHPYQSSAVGRVATLQTVPAAVLEDHHRRAWVRPNVVVGVAGLPEPARPHLEELLSQVPAGPLPDLALQSVRSHPTKLVLVDHPGPESVIQFAAPSADLLAIPALAALFADLPDGQVVVAPLLATPLPGNDLPAPAGTGRIQGWRVSITTHAEPGPLLSEALRRLDEPELTEAAVQAARERLVEQRVRAVRSTADELSDQVAALLTSPPAAPALGTAPALQAVLDELTAPSVIAVVGPQISTTVEDLAGTVVEGPPVHLELQELLR